MANLSNITKRIIAWSALMGACGTDAVDRSVDPSQAEAGVNDGGLLRDATVRRDGAVNDAAVRGTIVIAPSGAQNIDTMAPQPIQFTASTDDGAPSSISVTWSTNPKELGAIDPMTGLFTPSGAGGTLHVTAMAGSQTVQAAVPLVVHATQVGDPDFGKIPEGAGGIGGVGGEGGGAAITDVNVRTALDGPATVDPSMTWLYPYDATVWPRSLPAPLLMWTNGEHPALAVKLDIRVDDMFQAAVYLGPPSGLTQIDRLPIPQAIWRNANLSGRTMKVAVTWLAGDGKAYRAPKDLTWTIAPASLKGVVYYNSYGTRLAQNYNGALGGNGRFGGATLAIEGGSFDPKLVAGSTTSDQSGCRVCHTVSGDGSTLISQRNEGLQSSVYDLKTAAERLTPGADDGKFGWAALYPDGSAALGASGPPGYGQGNTASRDRSALYRVADGAPLTANGLNEVVTQAATPSFAPDGRRVVFNLYQGPGAAGAVGNGRSLLAMEVRRPDANTFEFSNPTPLFTAQGTDQLPGWPFFLPDQSGVVFELELAPGAAGEHLMTRDGARGELWWTDLHGQAHALDAANGKDYLPVGPRAHERDVTLQYEPTVAPIVAGGYAWVVFTSRRLYGNVATREPFQSDPRYFDLNPGNSLGPTTKKLWVTAIDIPPKPGADPSHPAFYLPAQELYAGNSRGFWVLDACKADGQSCEGGDECCNGYCAQAAGGMTCSVKPPDACAQEYDACNVGRDCCQDQAPLSCIAGRCAVTIVL